MSQLSVFGSYLMAVARVGLVYKFKASMIESIRKPEAAFQNSVTWWIATLRCLI